jgi:hypothetical protein
MFHNTVAHADDEQEEERKGISACVEYRHNDHESFSSTVEAISVLVFCYKSQIKVTKSPMAASLP